MIEKKEIEKIHDHICEVYGIDRRLIDEFKDDIIDYFCPQLDINLCSICGQPTTGIDYDYLVHDHLHLSCQLKEELGQEIEETK